MSDKKFKKVIISISVIGILSIIALVIISSFLYKNASMIEVISRLG